MPEQGWTPDPLQDLAALHRKAIDVGYPVPLTRDRIVQVTRVRRRDVRDIVGTLVWLEHVRAVREGREIDWEKVKPVETALGLLVSVEGQGRDELPMISASYWSGRASPKRPWWRGKRHDERYREAGYEEGGDGSVLP